MNATLPNLGATATTVFQPMRFLAWVAGAASGSRFRCTSTRFELSGALRFALEGPSGTDVLDLVARRHAMADAIPACYGALQPVEATADPRWSIAASWLARRLEQLRARLRVPVLELFQAEIGSEPHTFDVGLFHSRLGALFVPGLTRYGRHVFVSEERASRTLAYQFESDRSRLVLHLHLDAGHPDAVVRTEHLALVVGLDERSPAEHADPETQVERYVGFLVSLCDAPATTFRRRAPSRRAFVDDRVTFDARLESQFFLREVGHDYLNIFAAFWGLGWPAELLIHGERECGAMGTHGPSTVRRLWTSPLDVRPDASASERVSLTALDDVDLVKGGEDRLRSCLTALRARHPDRLLVVMDTCVPQVIGDDVAGVVREHAATGDAPIALLSCRMEEHNPFQGAQAFWLGLLRQMAEAAPAAAGRSVNLVGFGLPQGPVVRELTGLLGRVGVETNALLFPGLEADHARRFLRARLNVVNPWTYVRKAFEPIGRWSGLPVIAPAMPYGRQGARNWLRAVALAVNGSVPADLPDLDETGTAQWDELRRQASEHEIAFVTLSTQPDLPADPSVTQGIPLIATLLEMGFRVTVHCLDPEELREAVQRRPPDTLEAALREGLGADDAFRFHVAPDLPTVLSALGRPNVSLVYSEVVDDPRLRALGKEQLGPSDFQPGLGGSLNSLRALVGRARDPFRRRYARFLPGWRELP